MLQGVRGVNRGDTNVTVPIFFQDEIGFLAASFNGMVRQIKDRERRLSRHNRRSSAARIITARRSSTSRMWWRLVDANGVIRYVSPSLQRVLGYTSEQLVQRNVFEFVHPDQQQCSRASSKQPSYRAGSADRSRSASSATTATGVSWRSSAIIGWTIHMSKA